MWGKETANEVVEEFAPDHSSCRKDISLLAPIVPLCAETLNMSQKGATNRASQFLGPDRAVEAPTTPLKVS